LKQLFNTGLLDARFMQWLIVVGEYSLLPSMD